MTAPAAIARHPREQPPEGLGFAQLRARGIALAQALSGKHWTDYNLHDPGVTLLEALCYALTELAYRADFPVPDLLGPDAEGRLDPAALALHPANEALPCRATSAADWRQVLLDAVSGLDGASLRPAEPDAAGLQLGLHQLRLDLSPAWSGPPAQRMAQARAACRAQRLLGEDLAHALTLVQPRWCELLLEFEVGGPREAGEVLAEVYHRCATFIARPPGFAGLEELRQQGRTLAEIYTGPAMQNGFVRSTPTPAQLFVSDLGLQVQQVEGVQQLRRLALSVGGQVHSSGALPWHGPDWTLRLHVPGQAPGADNEAAVAALLQRQVTLSRRGRLLRVAPGDLISRLADLAAAGVARRSGHPPAGTVPLPRGRAIPATPYHSLQNDLPPLYGLGREGLDSHASPQQRAGAVQLKAYLVLFEQMLANGHAQLQHLHQLFSPRGAAGPSYWWQPLGEAEVPGLDAIYRGPPETSAQRQARLLAEVFAPQDPSGERKSRALDHLLALYGVTYTQNTLRQFWPYLSASELDARLLDNKARYLRHIVALTRDRGIGIDYSQPSWGQPANTAGLQRRVALLLGFRHGHTRSLGEALARQKRRLLDADSYQAHGKLLQPVAKPPSCAPLPLADTADTQQEDLARMQAALQAMPVLRQPAISQALLRCALFRERYRVAERQAGSGWPLWLGPDDSGHWWLLGHFGELAAAQHAADSLRRLALQLNDESEGLHLVEHVLLRPLGDSPAHQALQLPASFFELRLSLVLPAWPQRCQHPNFRLFAHETLQLNAPAHLQLQCLWLAPAEMQRFEESLQAWLLRKQHFSQAVSGELDEASGAPAERSALNEAACALIACLRPPEDAHG